MGDKDGNKLTPPEAAIDVDDDADPLKKGENAEKQGENELKECKKVCDAHKDCAGFEVVKEFQKTPTDPSDNTERPKITKCSYWQFGDLKAGAKKEGTDCHIKVSKDPKDRAPCKESKASSPGDDKKKPDPDDKKKPAPGDDDKKSGGGCPAGHSLAKHGDLLVCVPDDAKKPAPGDDDKKKPAPGDDDDKEDGKGGRWQEVVLNVPTPCPIQKPVEKHERRTMDVPVPCPVTRYQDVPCPVPCPVQVPVPVTQTVHVRVPVPNVIDRPVPTPVTVQVQVPNPVPTPVPNPIPCPVPQTIQQRVAVPVFVDKYVDVPVPVPVPVPMTPPPAPCPAPYTIYAGSQGCAAPTIAAPVIAQPVFSGNADLLVAGPAMHSH